MSDRNWTPVKLDWDKDVGIVAELNAGLKGMNEAASLDGLLAVYERQREYAKYLMKEGREKWERAYAMNVLRLTRPEALAPETLWLAVTAEARGDGKYDYAEVGVYSTQGRAVCSTIAALAKSGDLYERMTPDDLGTLNKYVSAPEPDWMVVYDHLRNRLRGMLVTVLPQELNSLDDEIPKLDRSRGTPLPTPAGTATPDYPRIKHSVIEYRHGDGGKGRQGVYLVAEMREFASMLTANDLLIGDGLNGVLRQIRDCIAHANADKCDRGALDEWNDFEAE